MSHDVPGYGVAFRIDDYRNRPTLQPVPQPVKTQRRRQQDSLAKVNQPQQQTIQQPIPLPKQEPIPLPKQQPIPKPFPQPLPMPITETKLTASDMAVLIQRRLPADILFQSDKPFEITNRVKFNPKPDSNTIQNKVVDELVSSEPKTESHKTENKKTNKATNNQWQCVKYACCCMCGCTICTSTLGLIIALYYEWLG